MNYEYTDILEKTTMQEQLQNPMQNKKKTKNFAI